MSHPTSAPNRSWVGVWWLRYTPGCRVITSPSSTDIRAISSRRWRRSAVASLRGRRARPRRREDPLRVGLVERGGADVGVAVVGGDGAVRDEVPPPVLQRRDEALVAAGVGVGRGAEGVDQLRPVGAAGLQVAVGAEGRQHPGADRRRRRGWPRGGPGRRTGRRWWPAPRCRSARAAPAAGSRVGAAVRRPGRRSRRRWPRTAARSPRRCRRARSPARTGSASRGTASQCVHSARQAARASSGVSGRRPRRGSPAGRRGRAAAG